ncbi:MAG TPA: citrate synthase [Miltoncostaeales bacterium]|jgi:citrate synthase|nr:citrate synthase [Miltoncostaeales bacterium]
MAAKKGQDTITVTDNRTGKTYEFPIADGTIKATDLRTIKVSDDDFGLMTYDPAFMNTASCKSEITFIDGDVGILRYRGYPIDQLAEKSSFLEVAYLLIHGELPTKTELAEWQEWVNAHVFVDESIRDVIGSFRHDAHPMAVLQAAIGGLSTLYPESKETGDKDQRMKDMVRLIAKTPTIGAWAFRNNLGRAMLNPDPSMSYAENILHMFFDQSGIEYNFDPKIIRALDVLLILHADHEQNCSTSSVRAVGSSETDVFQAASAGVAALYGPLHGGANEAVLKMLRRIGSMDNIPAFIEGVKKREELLMGFGHRVYKNYDPRATIVHKTAHEVFEITGVNPLLEIAVELERIALEDDFFVSRKLYPNVDFYSGLIYEALQLPAEMFTVMFAMGRMPGWLAQWNEMLDDKDQKIARPRQIYTGHDERNYVPITKRK